MAPIGSLAAAANSEGLALLREISALRHRGATQVAPMMFAVQVLVPVPLAALIFAEVWKTTPLGGLAPLAFGAIALAGTALLAASRAVAAVIDGAPVSQQPESGPGSLLALRSPSARPSAKAIEPSHATKEPP